MATFFCSAWPAEVAVEGVVGTEGAGDVGGAVGGAGVDDDDLVDPAEAFEGAREILSSSLRAIMATEMVGLCGVSSAIFIFYQAGGAA